MGNCLNCLYQGDMSSDEKGGGRVFCLVNGEWLPENSKCAHFREYADLSKDIRNRFAVELRQEHQETRRLNRVFSANWKIILVTLITSFIMFIITVKFFDKYIF